VPAMAMTVPLTMRRNAPAWRFTRVDISKSPT
jgi:hypothetical protein